MRFPPHPRTAEQVRAGHPDKLCDQIADAILDSLLAVDMSPASGTSLVPNGRRTRAGIEILAKGKTIVLGGEVRTEEAVDYDAIVRRVWSETGYPSAEGLKIINLIGEQPSELQVNSDRQAAGDQGVMVGYATPETREMMPREFLYATAICRELDLRMGQPGYEWLRPDGKAQVTLGRSGQVDALVVEAQHAAHDHVDGSGQLQAALAQQVIDDVLRPLFGDEMLEARFVFNGAGSFAVGGPDGDAGLVGRKIVCDAYGPRVPVGGGAFSGKDPTKIDRAGAYAARYIARRAVSVGATDGEAITVTLAYAIGETQPDMVHAITSAGRDLSSWVRTEFPDLSPRAISEELDLWRRRPTAWTYRDTARYGHFGRSGVPWEETG